MAIRLNDIVSVFRLEAGGALKALDDVAGKAAKADKSLQSVGSTVRKIGFGFAAFGAATTAFFASGIQGAAEEEEQLQQLNATVEATGRSFADTLPSIEAFIDGLAETTKFADDELRPALNRAILATNDVDKGMRAVELGAKIAAAGFGSVEQNATLVARLFEGQVGAIGRLIPQFRDLEDRLAAGATESDLAAEALDRLNKIASRAPSPTSLNLIRKSIDEIREAAGKAVLEGLEPLLGKLLETSRAAEVFAKTDFGQATSLLTAFAGVISTVVGGLLIFSGSVIKNTKEVIGFAKTVVKVIGPIVTTIGGLVTAFLTLGFAIAGASIVMDRFSKASDAARDKFFKLPLLQQFTIEMEELKKAIAGVEAGTLKAADATKTFNRFGIQNLEQAKARVASLERITEVMKKEKSATDDLTDAEKARAAADVERKRIEGVIASLEDQKQKEIELDLLKEQLAEKNRQRGVELARQAGAPQPIPVPAGGLTPIEQQGLAALQEASEPANELNLILQETDLNIQAIGTSLGLTTESATELLETLAASGSVAAAEILRAREQVSAFNDTLANLVAGAFDALAQLGANFFIDLSQGFDEAAKNAGKFFKQLVADLGRAIVKATILAGIISALPGGGFFGKVGNILGGLFQDPVADALARFEGTRFVDLFFQGVTRQFSVARDRLDVALTNNRDVASQGQRPMSVIVTEATPETAVEFTDRLIEPRVRERARQRSSRGTLSDAERDRLIVDNQQRLDALGAT